MKTFIKIAVLIVCLGLVFCLALSLTACKNDTPSNNYNDVSFGYINAKDCEDGNIDEEKIKRKMQFELGNTYYMIIDFTMQADRDSSGTDRLHTKLEIEPAAAIEATIQDAATSEFKEEVINEKINISLSYKIPDSAKTSKQTRLVIQLKPVLESDTRIKLTFESDNGLNAIKTTSLDDLIVGDYTQGLEYTKTADGGYSVSKGTASKSQQIVIPILKDDRYVTSIGDAAFKDCSSLTSITIPNSVTSIGDAAFVNCNSLKYNEYENGLYLGNDSNPYLTLIEVKDKSIASFNINSKTKVIHSKAFYNCSFLISVSIPESVTSLGNNAFDNCISLKFNEYDNGLYLGNGANPYLVLIRAKFKNVTNIRINDNTKFIHSDAFNDCSSLSTITIPNHIISIGNYVFQNCTSLTNVYITDIAAWCKIYFSCSTSNPFYYANNLYLNNQLITDLVIPDTVTFIGNDAFSNCNSLKNIIIPNSVLSIGSDAFSNCSSLNSVYITNIATWCKINFGGSTSNPLYYAANLYLNNQLVTDLVIPDTVTSISNYTFSGHSLSSITIPNNIISIGDYAFSDCNGLTSITCPINVISYVPKKNLQTVVITSGESIDKDAFSNGISLKSITIPNSVTNIDYAAFKSCSSLTRITLPFVGAQHEGGSNTHFGYIFGAGSVMENKDYVPGSLKEVIITGGASISDWAFRDCSSLTRVIIPNSVKSIGEGAFYDCRELISITIGKGVKSIGKYSFSFSTKLVEVYNLSKVKIKKGSTDNGCVGHYAFDIYTDISQPSKLTAVNDFIIHTNDNNKTLVSYIGGSTDITIPDGVTSIGEYAFYYCTSLTSITIPNSVTTIDDWAFCGCSSLTSITIPNSVTFMGGYAFHACNSLTSVVIGKNVTFLGHCVFEHCTNLTTIHFKGTKNDWNVIRKDYWDYGSNIYYIYYIKG